VPAALALGLVAAVVIAVVSHGSTAHTHKARAAHPATTPVALPSTGPAAAAAPIAADLARVLVNPASHRLRLIFTVFNTQTSRVVLLRVGQDNPGLAVRDRSFARFAAAGEFHPARLPLTLAPAQSAHITIDYGVRHCPSAPALRLRVPITLAARERGRISVDLAGLVPPRDWPRGLITVLCPGSSR
jgi:hypothetical protein